MNATLLLGLLAVWLTGTLAGTIAMTELPHVDVDGHLPTAGRGLLAERRLAVSSAGTALSALIHDLQRQNTTLNLPLHGGSLPALLTHRLGIYLLRPPAATNRLPHAQAIWLQTTQAQELGWQLIGRTHAAGVTAQRLANSGAVVLAVAPPGCGPTYTYATADTAVVAPTASATPSGVTRNGPMLAKGRRRLTARQVYGLCVTSRRVLYFRIKRPAATRLLPAFTQVLLNPRYYPDAQYLFDVAPGGRGDSAVVYYTKAGATTYLVMTYGIDTKGWAHTAWYLPAWTPGAAARYTTKLVVKHINLTYAMAAPRAAVNYYHVPQEDVVTFTPQPGSGGCASCGFWYSDDPKQALAFYVSSRSAEAVQGHLLTYAGSPLLAAEPLVDQLANSNLTTSTAYPPGACVPYRYQGSRGNGLRYAGELIWAPKWGSFRCQTGKALVTFTRHGNNRGSKTGASDSLLLQYYGKNVKFTKASHHSTQLPVLD